MNFNFSNLSLGAWLVQTVAAAFFTAGFVGFDLFLWRLAFDEGRRYQRLARIGMTVMPLALGALMLYGGVVGFMDTMMFTNIGLFVLVVPLFDMQITLPEYLLRAAGLLAAWGFRHAGAMTAWTGATVVTLLAILIGLRVFRAQTQVRARSMFLVSVFIAFAFWFTLPPLAWGLRVDGRLALQAAVMFIVMAAFTDYSWARQWQQYRENKRLKNLAAYDNLTNAKAYTHDQADISALFQTAQQQAQPLVLVALDIDRLRVINADHGHLAGNALLIQVVDTIMGVLQQEDLQQHFYRTGGEEFNIAFPDMTTKAVVPVVRACWQAIHDASFTYEGVAIPVTVSFGVTAVMPGDQVVDDLYKRADDNLYQAKQRGRDAITVDGVPMEKDQAVVAAPQYAFYTQPINDTRQVGSLVWGNELLLRQYDEAQQRWVLPSSFDLAVDQQVQLVYQAVARSACKNVAINLTLAQFADAQTAYALIACLKADDGPTGMTVEIVDVPDLATTRRITAIYRAAGIRIHIDDVGSDNSYELVRQLLPYVDGVKFAIQNLRRSESTARLRQRVRFWAEVAKKAHLRMILEGVEDQEDIDFATSLGIHYYQGYFFARPALPQAA